MNQQQIQDLALFANDIRRETMKEIASLGVGHMGGTLSIAEALAVLYGACMKYDPKNPQWEERDRFVLSKGHAGPALYAVLAIKGFFPMDWLETLNRPGTKLPSHCDRLKTPGVDCTTGSLGQGLSMAAGIALGCRMKGLNNNVYAICGDGECTEGQIWEAALFAGHRKLNHLIVFVDKNQQMLDGFTKDICDIGDIRQKFEDFAWFAQEVDGHDVRAIYSAIETAQAQSDKPSMIVLDTVKGKGISMYEGNLKNHNGNVTMDELRNCLAELDEQRKQILGGVC